MFLTKTVLISLLGAFMVEAGPLSDDATTAPIISTKEVNGGTLTYYGASTGFNARRGSVLEERQQCGNQIIECDTSNVPAAGPCQQLVSITRGSPDTVLLGNTQSMCFTVNQSTCCISWNQRFSGLKQGSLTRTAESTLNGCVIAAGRSGRAPNTNLQGHCVVQCLSNRPNGC